MSPELWRKVEAVFGQAAGLPPGQQEEFLAAACDGDALLAHEVRELLAEDERADSRIRSAVAGASEPRRLGPYRLVRMIGHGGMGAVYEAIRADAEYDKRVAIKTILNLAGGPGMLARFRAERQILASLDHPNIAKLLEGGTTPSGLPYLVMEYVDGEPLLSFCRRQAPNLHQRIRMFLRICDAVNYAHRHLVIHRDIKPANILVTAEGVPKLLDFGIAKLFDPDSPGMGDTTRLLTPDYASPEQLNSQAVTVATDVYSLGMVLREMLTECPPRSLASMSPAEVAASIEALEASLASSLPGPFTDRMKGDLDNILQMALRRDPGRRYASVDHLADDLARYLDGLPVRARKDTLWYRASKFVGRNKVAAIAAALVMASLVTGVVVANNQARHARRRFEQVRQLAGSVLFDLHDSIRDLPGSTAAREKLVGTSLRYLDGLATESGDDRPLLAELAAAYERVGDVQGGGGGRPNLGQTTEALASYEKSLAIHQKLPFSPEAAAAQAAVRIKVGALRIEGGASALAAESFRAAAASLEQARARGRADAAVMRPLADAYQRLGSIELSAGNPPVALEYSRKGAAVLVDLARRDQSSETLRELGMAHFRTAMAWQYSGELSEGLDSYREARRVLDALVRQDPGNPRLRRDLIRAEQGIANISGNPLHIHLGDTAAAVAANERALVLSEELAAADPGNVASLSDMAMTLMNLAACLGEGDPQRSAALFERAIGLQRRRVAVSAGNAEQRRNLAFILMASAYPLRKTSARRQAAVRLEEALRIQEDLVRIDPQRTQFRHDIPLTLMAMGDIHRDEGRIADADAAYRRAIEISEHLQQIHRSDISCERDQADSYERLGWLLEGRARDESRHYLQKSLEIWERWRNRTPANPYVQARWKSVVSLLR